MARSILLFGGGLLLSLMSSVVLAERLDQLGFRCGFPPGLIGLVTALGADSPEIASAVSAIISGQHDLGRGVIFGSNIFNIAALLGLSALVAGRVAVTRPALILHGGTALWFSAVVGAQAVGWVDRLVAGVLLGAVLLPYVGICALRPGGVGSLPLPGMALRWVERAVLEEVREEEAAPPRFTLADGLAIVPLLATIVVSATVMVRAAEQLGTRWHVSPLVVGTFVVATLTGLPNLIAALRLAFQRRGPALCSEAFNSNSLNLLAGAYVPTLLIQLSPPSSEAVLAIGTLAAITLVAIVLGLARSGFGRFGGFVLLAGYAAFTAAALWWMR